MEGVVAWQRTWSECVRSASSAVARKKKSSFVTGRGRAGRRRYSSRRHLAEDTDRSLVAAFGAVSGLVVDTLPWLRWRVVVGVSEARRWPSVTRNEKKRYQHRRTCLLVQTGQFNAGEPATKTLFPFLAGESEATFGHSTIGASTLRTRPCYEWTVESRQQGGKVRMWSLGSLTRGA